MHFGELKLALIRECTFKLDGGAMFGVVPKLLWERLSPADELNRILLSCNLLLLESPHGRVLVETGMGERWGDKERDRYEIKSLVSSASVVQEAGLSNYDVDFVVLSHLHFDHAGGATRYEGGALVPTFPKAKYLVQKGEWEFAHKANARAQASYRAADFEPLKEHGVLEIVAGDREVVPGIWVRVTSGHTRYHQIVTFESDSRKGIFLADIVPTISHLPPPWVMGYDHFPLTSCDAKNKWLTLAAQERYLVVFDHEPGVPWGYVEQKQDGKFSFLPLEEAKDEADGG